MMPAKVFTVCLALIFTIQEVAGGPCDDVTPLFEAGLPKTITSIDTLVDCMDTVNMSFMTMFYTLENLRFTAANVYSFTSIANSSRSSVQENAFGLEVHDSNVDLLAELEELQSTYALKALPSLQGIDFDSATTETLRDHLNLPLIPHAFEFHSALHTLFRRLNDAHTFYNYDCSSAYLILPLILRITVDANTQNGILHAAGTQLPEFSQHTFQNTAHLRPVEKIVTNDGTTLNPLEWLKGVADTTGDYHDAGQRINSLFHQFRNGFLGLPVAKYGIEVAQPSSLTFHFSDGLEPTHETIQWLAYWDTSENTDFLTQKCEINNAQFTQVVNSLVERETHTSNFLHTCNASQECQAFLQHMQSSLPNRRLQAGMQNTMLSITDNAVQAAFPSISQQRADEVSKAILDQLVQAPELPSQPKKELLPRKLQEESSNSCTDPFGATTVYSATFVDGLNSVSVLHKDQMMIYRLTGFGGAWRDVFHGMMAYMQMVRYAEAHGIKKVLVDVVSNGGGIVKFASILASLFTHDHDMKTICQGYSKRIAPGIKSYVESYGMKGVNRLIHPENSYMGLPHEFEIMNTSLATPNVVRQFLMHFAIYEEHLLNASVSLGFPHAPGAFEHFDELKNFLQSATSKEEMLRKFADHLQSKVWLPTSLYTSSDLNTMKELCLVYASQLPSYTIEAFENMYHMSCRNVNENSTSPGWAPYLGDELLNRDTLAPFADLEHFLDPVMQSWGQGSPSMYTKRGILSACNVGDFEGLKDVLLMTATLDSFSADFPADIRGWMEEYQRSPEDANEKIREAANFEWEDIAVLTDGLAGSAGSYFPTVLLASGKATLYSYGGLPGQAMDTSSFAGGNVLQWDQFWKESLYGALYAEYMDSSTEWAQQHSQQAFSMPMPTGAQNNFNYNMMFMLAFDKGETTLPREYYLVPASKHFDLWAPLNYDICELPEVRFGLYDRIGQETWCEVRQNPPSQHGFVYSSNSNCASRNNMTMTCADFKKQYKQKHCCGNPNQAFNDLMLCGAARDMYKSHMCCGAPEKTISMN